MLESLRRIVQEVNSAQNLPQVLDIMVREIKGAMKVDACNIYLYSPAQSKHVLMATCGLNPAAVGRVSLDVKEGLIGLVRERAEPVNVEDAQTHQRYRFVSDTDEVKFHAFLGVPIIHYRKVLGVLVIRQSMVRKFDENEESFLVTLAAQLSGTIVHAAAHNDTHHLFVEKNADGQFLVGLPGSPGIAVGTVVVVYPPSDLDAVPDRLTENPQIELTHFAAAVEAARQEMQNLAQKLSTTLPKEDRALFDAYMLMLKSDALIGKTQERIKAGNWAPGALRQTVQEHSRVFHQMDDPYFQERAQDLEDLGRRILKHLQTTDTTVVKYPERTVLVGEDISAAMLAEAPHEKLVGVISGSGSGSSHVSILARGMGLPAVMGVEDLPVSRMEGEAVILDGYVGRIYLSPSESMLNEFTRMAREEKEMVRGMEALNDLPAVTLDSHHVPLYANTGLLADIAPSLGVGAEGIGLYRTELPFFIREHFPGEEEQRQIYRQVLEKFSPRPVVLRTLDIGGDKMLPYFPISEANPFLGWRGMRITLDHPEIFLVQLRAMMHAAEGLNNLHILLPMITNVIEVDESLKLIEQGYQELIQEKVAVTKPKIGVMIEVPSAVYMADAISKRVDFLSIGTNDLTQYILAVDRNNSRVAFLYDSLEPAVLQALVQTIAAGHRNYTPVSVCGEMAGDPAGALLLLGMGVDSLSMSAASLPRIKWVIQSFKKSDAELMVEEVLQMEHAEQVRSFLYKKLEAADLGRLVRPWK